MSRVTYLLLIKTLRCGWRFNLYRRQSCGRHEAIFLGCRGHALALTVAGLRAGGHIGGLPALKDGRTQCHALGYESFWRERRRPIGWRASRRHKAEFATPTVIGTALGADFQPASFRFDGCFHGTLLVVFPPIISTVLRRRFRPAPYSRSRSMSSDVCTTSANESRRPFISGRIQCCGACTCRRRADGTMVLRPAALASYSRSSASSNNCCIVIPGVISPSNVATPMLTLSCPIGLPTCRRFVAKTARRMASAIC